MDRMRHDCCEELENLTSLSGNCTRYVVTLESLRDAVKAWVEEPTSDAKPEIMMALSAVQDAEKEQEERSAKNTQNDGKVKT